MRNSWHLRSIRNSVRIYSLLFVAFMAVFILTSMASAQPIMVRLLNGKNRKPQSKIRVYIVLGDARAGHTLDLKTDREGAIQFEACDAKTFQVRPVGEIACGEQPIGSPSRNYSVEETTKSGIVTTNDCGHFAPEPIRGQLTYLVRSASFSELFHN